ncbi:hypothetical protein D3OALGA1CA_2169 [Olavius algarvensis associated proteobacterium Delta 3]|nr:hypothetical protein D3OALGA1CA_2169 [Olavius algarvensis associated proteobacterium Delta 3]
MQDPGYQIQRLGHLEHWPWILAVANYPIPDEGQTCKPAKPANRLTGELANGPTGKRAHGPTGCRIQDTRYNG